MIDQIAIVLTGLLAVIALAANRIFLGCVIALIGTPFWLYATWAHDQWGMLIVAGAQGLVYLLAVVLRLTVRLREG